VEAASVTETRRATVAEVARAAGVSTATVVRALQDSPKVVPATRERVKEAARLLGYAPNPMARDLRHGNRVRAVGLVTTGFTNLFQASVAAGAEHELRRAGLELLIGSTDDDIDREPELARTMVDRRVSALLMMPNGDERDYLRREHTFGTPVVLVGRPANGLDVDVVMTEDDRAVDEATEQLIALGHRRIAALAGEAHSFRAIQRLAGFRAATARNDIPAYPHLVVTGLTTASDARTAMEQLMEAPEPPTAVLALNLGISTGVLLDRIANRRRLAFIALDETELSAGLGISAIVRDPRELGRQAARLAIERIEKPDNPPRTLVIPYTIARRGSGELRPVRVT
jgi:LacI family transcriptional regulator